MRAKNILTCLGNLLACQGYGGEMNKIISLLIIVMSIMILHAEVETIVMSSDIDFETNVLHSNSESILLEIKVGDFQRESVQIDNNEYFKLRLDGEPALRDEGNPELPFVNRNIIIDGRARNEVVFLRGDYKDFDMHVIPSKGMLYKYQDPSTIPYTFSDVYQMNDFYPQKLVDLSDPFIMRDYRGQTVSFFPFQYNPTEGVLRVYTRMVVEVKRIGECDINVLESARKLQSREFTPIYKNLFINYQETRYPQLAETGKMIIISRDSYVQAMLPFVNWKNQKGVTTEIYPVSLVGDTPTKIQKFIAEEYESDEGLTFVLFVGNGSDVPTFRVRFGAADPVYSLLAGDDNYPDIFVGRFSAQSKDDVTTQVERAIYYERDIGIENNWLIKGMGIASDEGSNPSDREHMNAIRSELLDYNYISVDQIYDPGVSSIQVTDSLHIGRALINYAGHGSAHSWQTTSFNTMAVNRLRNDFKLPLVFSVACQNGNFTSHSTSFAEAWVRATNDTTGVPTGAIAFYGSSVNQLWEPPMVAQNEITELLVNETMTTVGGLCYNASAKMIRDTYNSGANEFKNWHIFGDPSLQFRSAIPESILVLHKGEVFLGQNYYQVQTDIENALVAISYENQLIAADYTDNYGNVLLRDVDFPIRPSTVTITITAHNRITYIGDVDVVPDELPFVIIDEYEVLGEEEFSQVKYGDLANINISLLNVGKKESMGILSKLSTNDPYITIVDSTRSFNDLQPEESVFITNAFTIEIADNVPNDHLGIMSLLIKDEAGNSWDWEFSFRIAAPDIETGVVIIDDSEYGDNNGLLDPGETVRLIVPILNEGYATSLPADVSLLSANPLLVIEDQFDILDPILPGETVYASFMVTADEDIPDGSVLPVGFVVTTGMYSAQNTYRITIGPIIEDFESGDFSSFGWQFSGDEPWEIDRIHVFQGNYSAGSGDIEDSETSEISITLNVSENSDIKFYRRVSTEMNRDFLKFYIDGRLAGQWSGEVPWGEVSFPVTPGQKTFTWKYEKDPAEYSGYDKVWIDNIIFPTFGITHKGPIISAYPSELNFGQVLIDKTEHEYFYLRNFGSQNMWGTIKFDQSYVIDDNLDIIISDKRLDDGMVVYDYMLPFESYAHIKLSLTPQEERDYSGRIIITSNDEDNPKTVIPILAEGVFVSTEEPSIPLATQLKANYPNPFNPTTTISYSLADKEHVTIDVYNIKGQRITTLVNEVQEMGLYTVIWDGANLRGNIAASGIYFYRMKTDSYHKMKKMLFLK